MWLCFGYPYMLSSSASMVAPCSWRDRTFSALSWHDLARPDIEWHPCCGRHDPAVCANNDSLDHPLDRAKKIRLFVVWTVEGVTVLGGLLRLSNAWHRAMTSIGISSLATGEHSTRGAIRPGGPVASSRRSPGAHAPSDSTEQIISKTDETELVIVRTRVVLNQSSSRSSLDALDFGRQTSVEPSAIARP